MVALKPLHDAATIKRAVVADLPVVSGSGKAAMTSSGTRQAGVRARSVRAKFYPKQSPSRDPVRQQLEWTTATPTKSTRCGMRPTRSGSRHQADVTCVRVPVLSATPRRCTSNCGTRSTSAPRILREAPGVNVIDKRDRTGYITPKEAQGEFPVYVSRIRTYDGRKWPGAVGGV